MITRFRPWMAWAALFIGFACMLPSLGQRLAVEQANDTYELSMAYRDVAALRFGGVGVDEAFDELIDAGMTSASLDMITIRDLEVQGRLTLLGRADVLTLLLLAGQEPSDLPTTGAETFLIVSEDEAATIERIRQAGGQDGEVSPITVGTQTIYQVSGIESLGAMPLGYDDQQLEDLAERGLGAVLRVPSSIRSIEFATEELARVREAYGHDRFQFVGETTPFPGDVGQATELANQLQAESFTIVIPENVVQTGIEVFESTMDNIIRVRNLGLARRENDRLIDDTVRAVVERNVRIVVLRAHSQLTAEERLELTTESIGIVREQLPDALQVGIAEPFAQLEPTPLLYLGAALTSIGMAAFAYPLIGVLPSLAIGALLALMIVAMAVSGSATLGDLTRLAVAILAATVATFVARPRPDVARMTFQYARAGVVLIIGALTVSALAFDSAYLVAADEFWGVKTLLITPVVLAAAVAAYMSLGRPKLADVLPVLGMPVRLWHAIVAGVVVAAIGFMLLRSGNTGIEIDPELVLREQLEDLFAIRPRTKELLVGFPALVLGIMAAYRSRHGWWFYVAAAIATASAVNTFTHFHSPLVISTLRTVYGMALGLVVGLVLLGIAWVAIRIVRRLRGQTSDP
jgi:hypothetical protein